MFPKHQAVKFLNLKRVWHWNGNENFSFHLYLQNWVCSPNTGTEDAVEKIRHSFPVISARRGTSTLASRELSLHWRNDLKKTGQHFNMFRHSYVIFTCKCSLQFDFSKMQVRQHNVAVIITGQTKNEKINKTCTDWSDLRYSWFTSTW